MTDLSALRILREIMMPIPHGFIRSCLLLSTLSLLLVAMALGEDTEALSSREGILKRLNNQPEVMKAWEGDLTQVSPTLQPCLPSSTHTSKGVCSGVAKNTGPCIVSGAELIMNHVIHV